MSGDPYVVMIETNLFRSYRFEMVSSDAKLCYLKFFANCNRLGVVDFYEVWKSVGIQNSRVFSELYHAELVLEVNAAIAFLPDVFRANRNFMNNKYKSSIDMTAFAACMEKYPQFLSMLSTVQKKWIQSGGFEVTSEMLPYFGEENLLLSENCGNVAVECEVSSIINPLANDDGTFNLNGIVLTANEKITLN